MAIAAHERRAIDRQLGIRGNFDNARLVNPQKRADIKHSTIYAIDQAYKLRKVGYGAIVRKGWAHTYWQPPNTTQLIPVHVEANKWVLSSYKPDVQVSRKLLLSAHPTGVRKAKTSSLKKLVGKYS